MKFVHIADMHFDSPFTSLNRIDGLGNMRRLEQRQVFKEIIEYIKINEIPYLFIAGDLYEHEYVRQTTIEYIDNLFKSIPNTKIYIAPGNHDPYLKNSYYNKYKWSKNVHIFNSKIEKIELEDINIYGYGFNDFYCIDSGIEKIILEEKDKINILLTHGNLDGGYDDNREYNPISSKEIKKIGFDYVALGHIHKTNYLENTNMVYPGSTISFGFDELGKHGMIVGEIEKNKIQLNFIPIDKKEFKEKIVEVDELLSEEDLIEKINNLNLEENILYKIILKGKRNLQININKIYKSVLNKNVVKIKDFTKNNYNLEKLAEEENLKGLFVKEMLNKLNEENADIEIIEKAIEIGLETLEG